MSKKPLPKIKSLAELYRLSNTQGPLMERYQKLTVIAAENLGMMGGSRDLSAYGRARQHLKTEADAMDDDTGVVGEVNFVRDIEAKEA